MKYLSFIVSSKKTVVNQSSNCPDIFTLGHEDLVKYYLWLHYVLMALDYLYHHVTKRIVGNFAKSKDFI